MKLKFGNWKIDTQTLIRFQWKFPLPKIYVHEKFEKNVKWITRIITFIGIAISLISFPPIISLVIALVLAGLDFIFEKLIFEYTVMIVQPFPDFEVDNNQWLTNGYLFPNPDFKDDTTLKIHFGPVYQDKEYAIMFFKYMIEWNIGEHNDPDNNICISFVLENDNSYTTFFYANPKRKWLSDAFDEQVQALKLGKYGKNQQSLVFQMIYMKKLKIKEGTLFTKFIEQQKKDSIFYFVPFYIENEQLVAIDELKIIKNKYQLRKRNELSDKDIEYHFKL